MSLTPREIEYLILACYGGSQKEHADRMKVCVKTVEKHRTSLRHKIGINGISTCQTTALCMLQFAIRNGHIKLSDWLKTPIK